MTNETIRNRVSKLRRLMAENNINAYLIPSDDDHASEYVNDHFKFREWISGFTGSAGTALITGEEAFLWTDGRYFLQASEQLEGTGIRLMKMGEPDVPTLKEKISALVEASNGSYTLGFCGDTITASEGQDLQDSCGANIAWDKDLADAAWEDRPALKPSQIWEFPLSSCGRSRDEKLSDVRKAMADKGADVLLISDLMETCWLLNLRADDILNTPVFYSYTIVTADDCMLFALPGAVSDDIKTLLARSGVSCRDYGETQDALLSLCGGGTTLWADKSKTSFSLITAAAGCGCSIIDEPTPVEMMKAIKNETEQAATKNAHLKDGVAVTKFIYWLKKEMAGGAHHTEISACDKLEQLRRSQEECFDLSFPTIAGYMSNGAIIHYEPTPESDTALAPDGFLLVDSGGQYIDGTTDITRTIALGPLTDKMKKYYTLVLKGHIDLAMAKFQKGTTGKELDALARGPLKAEGLDYNHGTGHGVGHVLSVHEGPCYISFRNADVPLAPGMITSDEPGIYIENEFGVRIENEVLCVSDAAAGSDATASADAQESDAAVEMLAFETLTVVPYEKEAIVPEMLTDDELAWLNAYHARVRKLLLPRLDTEEAEWLTKVTAPLKNK